MRLRRLSLFLLTMVVVCPLLGEGRERLIVFTGDILLDRGVRAAIDSAGIDHLFSPEIDSLFAEADVVVGNLECPATDILRPMQKFYIFRAEPQWLNDLHRHGITHLNMANNHTVDQGRLALMDTRRNIIRAGIIPIGADSTMSAASCPINLLAGISTEKEEGSEVYLFASLRLPLENYAYLPHRASPSQEPFDTLCARVSQLRQQRPQAIIIVSLHWGEEHTVRPQPSQVLEAHRLIDAGADALICHHTHTLQTIETYHGRPIYYSIGNFIFDPQRPLNRRAAIVALTLRDGRPHFQTIPIYIDGCTPRIVSE